MNSPSSVLEILGDSVASFSIYFANLLITRTFTGIPIEMLRIVNLLDIGRVYLCFDKKRLTHRQLRTGAFADCPMLYGWIYPNILMGVMIMCTYACVRSTAAYSHMLMLSSHCLLTIADCSSYFAAMHGFLCVLVHHVQVSAAVHLHQQVHSWRRHVVQHLRPIDVRADIWTTDSDLLPRHSPHIHHRSPLRHVASTGHGVDILVKSEQAIFAASQAAVIGASQGDRQGHACLQKPPANIHTRAVVQALHVPPALSVRRNASTCCVQAHRKI